MLKKISISIISVIVFLLLFEVFQHLIFSVAGVEILPYKRIYNEVSKNSQILGIHETINKNVQDITYLNNIHPYLGFSGDRKMNSQLNTYGFLGPNPVTKRSNDKVIISIFGGSVADQLYYYSKDKLIHELEKNNTFKNKKIEILNLSRGAYKQPQQLLTLTYFYSLGAEYDVVINIDGFNEVYSNPLNQDYPVKLNLSYPHEWNRLIMEFNSNKILTGNQLYKTVKIKQLYNQKQNLKKLIRNSFLKNSSVILNIWKTKDYSYSIEIADEYRNLMALIKSNNYINKSENGLKTYQTAKDIIAEVVRLWKTSSLQMNSFSKANHSIYLHFLQPNQYVNDSKIFNLEEKNNYLINSDLNSLVDQTYYQLINEGKELKLKGVEFVDLTMIFKNKNETLYEDSCCHLNQAGYDLMAKEITENIIDSFSKR